MYKLNNEGKLGKFDEIFTFGSIICDKKGEGEYCLKQVFQWTDYMISFKKD